MSSTAAYESLPSLGTAAAKVDGAALDLLQTSVREFFLHRNMHESYGIALLHKHFRISKTERLVEYGNTSTPWSLAGQNDEITSKYEGLVVPRTYMLFDGKRTPYEFSFVPEVPKTDTDFEHDALHLLHELGLAKVFGLRLLEGRDPLARVEITEGRANIMVSQAVKDDDIQALWVFGVDDDDRCNCREYCVKVGGQHDLSHGCS